MSVFLQPIYTQTVGAGGVASITFNNIPQGFTDLKVELSGQNTTTSGACVVRFNGVTTGYSTRRMYGNGSSVLTDFFNESYYLFTNSSDFGATNFSISSMYISDYTNGNFKQVNCSVAQPRNATNSVEAIIAGLWENTAPITSITVTPLAGNIAQHSTITVYGVSNVFDTVAPTAPTIGTTTDLGGILSVPYTAAANDRADTYRAVTSPTSSTVFGVTSPAIVPVATSIAGNTYTAQVASVNSLGSSESASSNSVTTYNNFASIATYTADGSTQLATFSNIPQYYTHLEIRALVRVTGGGNLVTNTAWDANNNSSAIYTYHLLRGNGSTNDSIAATGMTNAIINDAAMCSGNAAGMFGGWVMEILNYTSSLYFKTVRQFAGCDNNSTATLQPQLTFGSNQIGTFNPITTLRFNATNGNWAAGTVIALYGKS
jgi:hypothetical protein